MIDDALNWKYQISPYIKSRILRNGWIISIFRHYLSLQQLKQLHYNIIISFIHMYHMASYDGEVLTKHTFKIKPCCQTYLLRHSLRAQYCERFTFDGKCLLFLCSETYLPMA